jgi:putative ABC transport system substrate-binding protein
MRRREFIALLGGAATAWPLAAHAQQSGKLPTIGFLGLSTRSAATEWTAAFVQRLRELGRIEGRTITIEYRWGEGREERFAEFAAEFVRLKVDIIVTAGTLAVVAAKQATTVIPIVFAAAGDPVEAGLVASLARPGGNVTGLSSQTADLAAKRLEILRKAVPGLRRLAILSNVGNRLAVLEMGEVQAAAGTLLLEVVREIAEYCESDVLNTYRVWLRYELFRGRLCDADFQVSEACLVDFVKARGTTQPHLQIRRNVLHCGDHRT